MRFRIRSSLLGSALLGVAILTGGCASSSSSGGNPQSSTSTLSIVSQPSSQKVTVGHTATFTVKATSAAALDYQWQKNGANIAGATSASYTTPPTTTADNGAVFQVVVRNATGSVTSGPSTLTVDLPPVPPMIAIAPRSQRVAIGKTAVFAVTASGTAPLNYRWYRGGQAVGNNASRYTTPPTTAADNNTEIRVAVGNQAGTMTSPPATLTVDAASQPAIGAPAVSLSPGSVFLGIQFMGATSAQGIVTLTNTGSGPLTINSLTTAGANSSDFSLTSTCPLSPSTLAAGANCLLLPAFQPTAGGPRKSAISISDNAAGNPQTVILTGVGAAVSASPTSLSFGSQTIGMSSSAQRITLTNTGSVAVNLWQIAIVGANPGDFPSGTTCGSSLGMGASCTVSVTFNPTATGTRGAAVLLSDDGGGSPQSVILTGTGSSAAAGNVNVLTYHNDNARTGQNLNEAMLTTSNVNTANFGKKGFLSVQGLVDAEPLYVSNLTVAGVSHNVVFVVTEHDLVYAFDADTFTQLWQISVLGANETPSDDHGCSQVTPEIGITSTPVIDLNAGPHGTIFVVGMSKDTNGKYYQRLHALDLSTGTEKSGSPTIIQATFPNSTGQVTFDPAQYKERVGLLLLNGVIYMGWASHCDFAPYTGWIMGYSESTLQQVSVLDISPNGSDGAVWMSGAGLAADTLGNIYFLDGNGTFDTTLNANGFPASGDYGNAFLKLSTGGNPLSVADYFTMHNTVSESDSDLDLGSGGALVLPDLKDDLGNTWHLAVGAGKDSIIYVVNRDSMGKFNPNDDNAMYQEVSFNGLGPGGVWAMPAYFNNTIYYGAVSDTLKAFTITNAKLMTPPASSSATGFAYPGMTPSICANGASNGIVWAVENNGGNGVLHAYDATNLANELYNSDQAGARDHFTDNKFITPMIANSKLYVGAPTGVIVFGLLH